jgi:hypothetical protein
MGAPRGSIKSVLAGLVAAVMLASPAAAQSGRQGKGHKPPPVPTDYEAPPKPILSGGEAPLAPPQPAAYIETVFSIAPIDRAGDFVQNAACGPGQQLLGGGFYTTAGNYSHYVSVKANYPSSDDTWTAVFHSSSGPETIAPSPLVPPFNGVTVAAYAYCFHASGYPLGLITVSGDTGSQGAQSGAGGFGVLMKAEVNCPDGSVLTGGGYSVDGPSYDSTDGNTNTDLTASLPTVGDDHVARGWRVLSHPLNAGSARTTHAYVRCATKGLNATAAAELAQDLTQLPTAVGLRDFQTTCPDGAVTTSSRIPGTSLVQEATIAPGRPRCSAAGRRRTIPSDPASRAG